MTTVFNLEISESPQQLQRLLCQHQHARDRDRLRALYLRKTGQVRSRRELAQGCNDSTLYRWFWLYQQQGLEGLLEHRLGALQAGSQAQARAQALSPSRPAAAATVQKKLGGIIPVLEGHFREQRPLRYFCLDESRWGLRTELGRRITLPGVNPVAPVVQWHRAHCWL